MRGNRKAAIAVSLVAIAATVLAGCSSSKKSTTSPSSSGGPSSSSSAPAGVGAYNAAFDSVVRPSTTQGGTLNLVATSDCDSWDPQRTYYGWCWNMQRLFTRSLLGYQVLNGTKFVLAPDLATTLGTHNADFSQWTYTLKPGLKFSNGAPITPNDIKWGVERLFATDVINGGPASYFLAEIKTPKNYAGPYKDGADPFIVTTANTIQFNLNTPYADFPYLMAMAASAPVPATVEGGPGFVGATYAKHPVSSGPFEFSSYTANKSVTFIRNPDWSQSTDTIHHPLADKIVLTIDTNPVDADSKLQAGIYDANASAGVSAGFQTAILTTPSLKANADNPVASATDYLAVMPSVIPNVYCRQAIFYASSKAGYQRAYGGDVAGTIAGSMTPPGIPGYDPTLNPYPVGSAGTGDVAAAKAALAKCGKPNGFSTKMAYATPSTHAAAAFQAEQTALARVGIKITPATADASSYYSTFIGSPNNIKSQGLGIANAGWGADFPTGYGFYNSIANGAAIVPTGNTNYPSLNDPVINNYLNNAPKGTLTETDWLNFNKRIMADAVYLPMVFVKTLYYRSPKMTNVTSDNALAFGIYDFVNCGVSS